MDGNISSELLAAYLEGNATAEETLMVFDAITNDAEVQEVMRISQNVDIELKTQIEDVEILPMTSMAASCGEHSYCCLQCEKFILERHNIECDEHRMLLKSLENGWQKAAGTALHNIGRHLESEGLLVQRRYCCNLNDIITAIEENDDIIVAVDGGELIGDKSEERDEDLYVGEIPDHTVVILSYNAEQKTITLFDPNSDNVQDTYALSQFMDAWADSKYYLVTANTQEKAYIPHPIDISDVILGEELDDLREAIAENAHEVWAEARQAEGWTYGPQRDDVLKQTPDMVPYSRLPESEKTYDREMAMKTIKLLKKLGYELVKK